MPPHRAPGRPGRPAVGAALLGGDRKAESTKAAGSVDGARAPGPPWGGKRTRFSLLSPRVLVRAQAPRATGWGSSRDLPPSSRPGTVYSLCLSVAAPGPRERGLQAAPASVRANRDASVV